MIEAKRQNRKIKENDQELLEQPMMPEERRIARLVREAESVTTGSLEAQFGISPMTIRRALAALEEGRVRRIHGGAVLPEFAGHEDSFWHRLEKVVDAKERMAEAAVTGRRC